MAIGGHWPLSEYYDVRETSRFVTSVEYVILKLNVMTLKYVGEVLVVLSKDFSDMFCIEFSVNTLTVVPRKYDSKHNKPAC